MAFKFQFSAALKATSDHIDAIIEGAIEAAELVQHEIFTHARKEHYARTIFLPSGKQRREASMAGANRVWNIGEKTPRYGDISGTLSKSIRSEKIKITSEGIVAIVAAGTAYAFFVEYGSETAVPHPFMGPAADHGARYIQESNIFEKRIAARTV